VQRERLARNVLVSGGAYYASMWVAPPFIMAFAPITNGLTFLDCSETAVIMPLVLGIPLALVAGGAGALTAWLVESDHAWGWAVPGGALCSFQFYWESLGGTAQD